MIVLNDSKFFRCFLNLYNISKGVIIKYSHTSLIIRFIQRIKKELYYLPVRTVSVIVVIAVSLGLFFSILLKKEIELSNWIFNLLFLFIGLAGLSCNATWEDIKKTSFVLKQRDRYFRL